MNRKLALGGIVLLIVLAGVFLCWQMGTFAPGVGAGRPAYVYLPDGTVTHTTWDVVFRKLKTRECYKDPNSGGFRYKTDSGVWGIALHPNDPAPDPKTISQQEPTSPDESGGR